MKFAFCFLPLALCFLLLASCDLTSDRERKIYTQDDTAVEVGRDVEILYSDSAVVRVRVRGPVLHNFTEREDPRQEFPEGVQIDFLEPDLSVKSTITAKNRHPARQGSITARDSVESVNQQAGKIGDRRTRSGRADGQVSTEKFVKVTKPGEVIYGYGLEAEQDFSYWKILVPKGGIKVKAVE